MWFAKDFPERSRKKIVSINRALFIPTITFKASVEITKKLPTRAAFSQMG